MICRVVSRGGSKILHLRSSIMIRNQTSLPLLFTIDQQDQKKEKKEKQDQKDQKEEEGDQEENSEEAEALLWSRVVSPFETVPVPMHLTDRTLLVTPVRVQKLTTLY
jgi:hypothetical protein